MEKLEKISRKMSKILRHDSGDLIIDKEGYILVNDLINYFNITLDELKHIVETNDKKRFAFNDDFSKIRASQGHSKGIAEKIQYTKLTAVQEDFSIYHGTDNVTAIIIKQTKILKGNRLFVHWTKNLELATKRANQKAFHNKSNPCIIELSVKSYINSGGKIFISENDVYLTNEIEGNKLKYNVINNGK